MAEYIISFFSGIPHGLSILFLSMIPITELRASIPVGLEVYHMGIIETWIIAVIGDLIPAVVILYIVPFLHDWIMKQRLLGQVLTHVLSRAEKKFSGKYSKYGALGLIIFVAIPLPFTGSWTGSLAAFVFNIPFKKSFPLIAVGVCIAGTLVTLITLFASGTIRSIL